MLVLFNKPFGVLCQFSGDEAPTLANYINIPNVYPAGRLDKDSEGLLLLTDDGALQQRITHPKNKLPKTYWAQIEGVASDEALAQLRKGLMLNDGMTLPAKIERLTAPAVWPRDPPIRYRKNIADSWLSITLVEGRNRQVRRMTAAIGHPTLRLIRYSIGEWTIDQLQPGEYQQL
ncbi:MAG: pseudouridine synthase [Gammaproteobacteria bacterium]|nr:pseudouridine synthase [Gammaproteobacteria bacterium]